MIIKPSENRFSLRNGTLFRGLRLYAGMPKILLIILLIGFFGQLKAQKVDFSLASTEPVKTVSLFPNPATDVISVLFDQPLAGNSNLVMYTIIGNEVNIEPELVDEFEVRIRVRDLPSGYYLLAVRNEKSGLRVTRKFLKR